MLFYFYFNIRFIILIQFNCAFYTAILKSCASILWDTGLLKLMLQKAAEIFPVFFFYMGIYVSGRVTPFVLNLKLDGREWLTSCLCFSTERKNPLKNRKTAV